MIVYTYEMIVYRYCIQAGICKEFNCGNKGKYGKRFMSNDGTIEI